jgi:carbamoyl-phosphate synthase small subunit
VRNVNDRKVRITSQNHGFAIDPKSMPSEAEVLETNVNDGTVEALRHKELPIISWQYHPEAQPGPLDSIPLFEAFHRAIKDRRWP